MGLLKDFSQSSPRSGLVPIFTILDDNIITNGFSQLKLENSIEAGSLGYPDFNFSLQVMLFSRNSSYCPL